MKKWYNWQKPLKQKGFKQKLGVTDFMGTRCVVNSEIRYALCITLRGGLETSKS